VAVYAQATRAWVRVHQADEVVHCCIRDDGAGFGVRAAMGRRGEQGIGLLGMRERGEALGGTLPIGSAPARGRKPLVAAPLGSPER
jgi:signal transduction histidine kinase